MTSPEQGAPAPGPDRPFAAPGTGSGWGDAPATPAAPAPSGYEARLPAPPADASPYAVRDAAPTSPYGAPEGAPPGYGATYGGDAPGSHATSGYDAAPGYGLTPGYGAAPGYGATPSGAAAGYGATQPGYGAAQPGYSPAQPGYGTPYAAPVGGQPVAYAPYGTWAPPAAPATDGLAIASLVLSCSSFLVYLTAPVGLGLGIAALRRIRRTGAQGRGLAIAGIVVGGIVTAFMLAFLVLMVAVAAGSSTSSSWMTNADAGAVLGPVLHAVAGAAPR